MWNSRYVTIIDMKGKILWMIDTAGGAELLIMSVETYLLLVLS